MKLFTEPFDLDEIERVIATDFDRFSWVASIPLGSRKSWDVALAQLVSLFDEYDRADRDDAPLYKIFDLLARLAMDHLDSVEMLESMAEQLGFDLSEKIVVARLIRSDPHGYRRKQNVERIQLYVDRYAALRDRRWADQARAELALWVKEQGEADQRRKQQAGSP